MPFACWGALRRMNEVMRVEQLPPPASAQQPPGGSKVSIMPALHQPAFRTTASSIHHAPSIYDRLPLAFCSYFWTRCCPTLLRGSSAVKSIDRIGTPRAHSTPKVSPHKVAKRTTCAIADREKSGPSRRIRSSPPPSLRWRRWWTSGPTGDNMDGTNRQQRSITIESGSRSS